MTHTAPLAPITEAIKAAGFDLYLVPMVDEFQGEYIPAYAARLPHVSGFTGSAGVGVLRASGSQAKHVLFVDGRYTLQAAREVDAALFDVLNSGETSFIDWLGEQAENATIGFDPWLINQAQLDAWKKATQFKGITWKAHSPNVIDTSWTDQPSPPAGNVILHPLSLAGRSYEQKRAALLDGMKKQRADAVVFTQADSINWLLNIRGDDVPFNPLLLAHMVLRSDGTATLWTHPHALASEVTEYLAQQNVVVASLRDVFDGKVTAAALGARVIMDPAVTAVGWLALAEQLKIEVIRADDPAQLPKALKHEAELAGMRAAHVRDGLALVRFFHWFDTQVTQGKFPTELEIVATLEQFRARDALYRGASFATISGSGPNGAIVHYRADETTNRKTQAGELLLLDSGGQYVDGTTDITRTVFVAGPSRGTPSARMKEHVTRVLKGHIALGAATFPAGTTGLQLDVLARQHLWEVGLDFDHGTGHGVGAYLCVHEGPQRISKRGGNAALHVGMILSNEPGYYLTGQYGIRIENLVTVIERQLPDVTKPMLGFETLTLVPIDTRLIEISMLTASERNWLNAYHQRVYKAHEANLEPEARAWLMAATRAV